MKFQIIIFAFLSVIFSQHLQAVNQRHPRTVNRNLSSVPNSIDNVVSTMLRLTGLNSTQAPQRISIALRLMGLKNQPNEKKS
jgi:hypothetical protein